MTQALSDICRLCAPHASTGAYQHPEARPDPRGRLQSGARHASIDRTRDAERPARATGDGPRPRRRAVDAHRRVVVRQNLTAENAALATRAEPAMLDHGRPCHPDCWAPDHPGEPTSQSRFREPGAAAAVGCLPSHPSEADRSLVRPAVLGRPPTGLAGLEVGLGDRPARHGHRLASPRLRVVLAPTVASEGRPSAGRRRRATPAERWPSRTHSGTRRAFTESC